MLACHPRFTSKESVTLAVPPVLLHVVSFGPHPAPALACLCVQICPEYGIE
jgi:hypothetical protein